MKQSKWIFAGLALFSAPAFSQSSVTLYGVIDTGIEFVSHANATGDKMIRMPGITGEIPSRWGLRGTEDLGGGLKTIFQLESGFNPRGGDLGQGGRLFGRQAWVGLQGPWGTVSFGRQYSMTFWGLTDSDILGPDIYGSASLDTYIPNARSDNTIAYMGTFRGLTLGATYSFGRDSAGTGNSPGQGACVGSVAGHFTQCRQWSAMIKYDAPAFGVSASYDEQRGGAGAAANFFNGIAPFALTNEGDKDVRMQLSGYGKLGPVRLGAGWIGRHVETISPAVPDVRSNLFFVGAAYQVTPSVLLDGEAFRIVNSDQNTRATMTTLRGTYFLSKATAVYLQSSYLWNSAHARYTLSSGGGGTTPAAGVGQLGVIAGIRHLF
ncbi:porin [Burkholderia sp. Ac-20353]|uniref:porin n=1 Tax=Burkholderia sp. Ac-20353 TaxID=2703894 RepID=UPI00197C03C3|nr:porin [Burkholderia sp. Ac-20353]MBN3788919.1 porin [Burkholderia sp. Ac-20353]